MELALCHIFVTWNFEVTPRFLENLYTPSEGPYYYHVYIANMCVSEWCFSQVVGRHQLGKTVVSHVKYTYTIQSHKKNWNCILHNI